MLTLTKGLPLAYNRDLQEDRQSLFDAVHTSLACVSVMRGAIDSMTILPGPDLKGSALLATEIADYLASKGVPFREAHHISGRIVNHCEKNNKGLHELSLEQYRHFHEVFDVDLSPWLDPEQAAERRNSRGGTAWSEVMRQIAQLRRFLA